MKVNVRVKKLSDKATLPRYATEGSAGFDLTACMEEKIVLKPGGLALIPTGIAIQIEDRELAAFCFARSGLAIKHGIALSNGVGVIDNDYTGEIKVGMVNLSGREYTVHPGDRIAQVVILPVYAASFFEVQELEETKRAAGGFGSTGK